MDMAAKSPKSPKTQLPRPRGRPPGRKFAEVIHVRLEPDVLDRLDKWATRREVDRSEAIRRAVRKLLGR